MFFRRPQPKVMPKNTHICMIFKLFAGFFFYHMYMGFCSTFSENNCFWKTRIIKSCTYGEEKKHFHGVKIIYICVALISMVWYSRVVFDKKMLAKNLVFFNRKLVSHFPPYIFVALISMVWYSRVVLDKKMLAKNFVFFNRKLVNHFPPPMSLYITFAYPPPPRRLVTSFVNGPLSKLFIGSLSLIHTFYQYVLPV